MIDTLNFIGDEDYSNDKKAANNENNTENSVVNTPQPKFTIDEPTTKEKQLAEHYKQPSKRNPVGYKKHRNQYSSYEVEKITRTVNENGLTPSEEKVAQKLQTEAVIKRRTPRNGRLNKNEINFYKNLGLKGTVKDRDTLKALLTEKVGETKEQKKRRERIIKKAIGALGTTDYTRFTPQDRKTLNYIVMFKYVSEQNISKLLQVKPNTAYQKLDRLRKFGLVAATTAIGVPGQIWYATDEGMMLSGFELPRGNRNSLTLSMVAHQFTVNHVAAHVISSGVNVLREKQWPVKNLVNSSGKPIYGDKVVSELQIQSSFGKVRGYEKAAVYIPQLKKQIETQFKQWEEAGGAAYGPSPEFQPGNEFMWTLFPPVSNEKNYHVPDLIVARDRTPDGKPKSIAIEVELLTKSNLKSYYSTLDAYRTDNRLYEKVIWICRTKGTANKVKRIAEQVGLWQTGKIKIVPIIEGDGKIITNRDTWKL